MRAIWGVTLLAEVENQRTSGSLRCDRNAVQTVEIRPAPLMTDFSQVGASTVSADLPLRSAAMPMTSEVAEEAMEVKDLARRLNEQTPAVTASKSPTSWARLSSLSATRSRFRCSSAFMRAFFPDMRDPSEVDPLMPKAFPSLSARQ